jgi:carboxypeptidase-like protein
MKTFFRLTASTLFLFSSHTSFGQTSILKGSIKDKQGIPLSGATITIDNSNSGTIADRSGHYKLMLTPGRHYIAVSHIGYTDQIIIVRVDKDKSVERNFALIEQYKNCHEVVVAASARARNSNAVNKNSSSDQIRSTESKLSARQLELPLLNNILDY